MLHTKFRGNWPAGSGEEDFKRVFTIYGHGGHLGHVTSIMSSYFHFLEKKFLKGFYNIWAWRPSWSCNQHHVIKFSFPCT